MRALIVVDVQNDFLPGGALAVGEGDAVIPIINDLMPAFGVVVATQDWHPREHRSFAANHPGRAVGEVIDLDGLPQVLWPVHCVQGTAGAEFGPGLAADRFAHVARKGTDPRVDSYSGFFDNGGKHATTLDPYLRQAGATELFVVGLATDYCVKATVLDGVKLGYRVTLVEDACRGVGLKPGDVQGAVEAMRKAGVRVLGAADVLAGPR